MFRFLTRRKTADANAYSVYRAIMAQARREELFAELGVPDTLDGRFEMLLLHAIFVISRLRELGKHELAQRVFDIMFDDMDQALREIGVSDIAVPRKVRQMAEAYYGRGTAYGAAIKHGDPAMFAEALARNVFPDGHGADAPEHLARYGHALVTALSDASGEQIIEGRVDWPTPAAFLGIE